MGPTKISVSLFTFGTLLDQVTDQEDNATPLYLVSKLESDNHLNIGMCDLIEAQQKQYKKMTIEEIQDVALRLISGSGREQLSSTNIHRVQIGLAKLRDLRIKKIKREKERLSSWTAAAVQVVSVASVIGVPIAYYISRAKTKLTERVQRETETLIKERTDHILQNSYDLVLAERETALRMDKVTTLTLEARLIEQLKNEGDDLIIELFADAIKQDQGLTITCPAKKYQNAFSSVSEKLQKTQEADTPGFKDSFVKEQVLAILETVSDDPRALRWLKVIQAICHAGDRIRYPDDIQVLNTRFSIQQLEDEESFMFDSCLGRHSIVITGKEHYKVTVNENPQTLCIENIHVQMDYPIGFKIRIESEGSTFFTDTDKKIYYTCSFDLSSKGDQFRVSNLKREFLTVRELALKAMVELLDASKPKAIQENRLTPSIILKELKSDLRRIKNNEPFTQFERAIKNGMPFTIYNTTTLVQNSHSTYSARIEGRPEEEDCTETKNRFVEEQVNEIRRAIGDDPNAESWFNAIRSLCQMGQILDVAELKGIVNLQQSETPDRFQWTDEVGAHKFMMKEHPSFSVEVHLNHQTGTIDHVQIKLECPMELIELIIKDGTEIRKDTEVKMNYTCTFKVVLNEETFEIIDLNRHFA